MPSLSHHWRLLVGALVGIAAFWVAKLLHLPTGLASLIGWNVGAVVFVGLIGILLHQDAAASSAPQPVEVEGAQLMTILVLGAVAASLAATLLALNENRLVSGHAPGARPWPLALSVSTLVMSWTVIQTIFTLRYAREYFGDDDRNGTINGGVEFKGDPPQRYRDFIYVAICIGATSQVSDFNILTSKFRRLVNFHAVISFWYNVSVLALGINMAATLLGQ